MSKTNFGIKTNSVDPDQTVPVCYRDIINGLADDTQQTAFSRDKQPKS